MNVQEEKKEEIPKRKEKSENVGEIELKFSGSTLYVNMMSHIIYQIVHTCIALKWGFSEHNRKVLNN